MKADMPGNKHFDYALQVLEYDHESQLGWETADAKHLASQLEANTSATLALAYEQRTANLIALEGNIIDHKRSDVVKLLARLGLELP